MKIVLASKPCAKVGFLGWTKFTVNNYKLHNGGCLDGAQNAATYDEECFLYVSSCKSGPKNAPLLQATRQARLPTRNRLGSPCWYIYPQEYSVGTIGLRRSCEGHGRHTAPSFPSPQRGVRRGGARGVLCVPKSLPSLA